MDDKASPIIDLTQYPIDELEEAEGTSGALVQAVERARQAQSYAAHGSSPVAERGTVK